VTLYRTKVLYSGWNGGPGVNVLHFEMLGSDEVDKAGGLLHNAYTGIREWLLPGVTVTIDTEWLEIEPSTGQLNAVVAGPPGVPILGSGIGTSMPRGTVCNTRFNTDAVVEGKRLTGRTFIGPLAESAIDTSGQISSNARADIGAMFNGFLDVLLAGDARLMVYHRPRKAQGDRPASEGFAGHVQSVVALQKTGNLRSRRD
jgi:hypothetical protein